MALNDTPWIGYNDDKLYLQSGQFTSTIKTSQSVGGIDAVPYGISWDGTNTPWGGNTDAKLYLQSGQFTSTLKTSQLITAIETAPSGISWDGTNTPWCGFVGDRLYLQSGQFTSTLKTSEFIGGIDSVPTGISYDGTNTPFTGQVFDKLYLQSGQFTSTVKTSEDVSVIDKPSGISYDGTNTPWGGNIDNKLYLQSGQFTSTVKTSEDVSVIEGFISGIETNNINGRLDLVPPDITVEVVNLSLTGAMPTPTLTGVDVIFSASVLSLSGGLNTAILISDTIVIPDELTLGLLQEGIGIIAGADVFISLLPLAFSMAIPGLPIISGDAILLLPGISMISQETGLSIHAPSINVTNDIRIIVTNTRNFAISEYTNFGFNSMCLFNGKYLYANSSGIYEAGGDNDNGTQIDASYKTGAIDIYTTEIQRLRDVYLSFRSDGDIQLFSVGDEINPRTYFITPTTASTIHERRVKFEKGIKDRHFNFGVSNINGSTLEIDSIEILTEPIRKRR
jgi:hypothetical protein